MPAQNSLLGKSPMALTPPPLFCASNDPALEKMASKPVLRKNPHKCAKEQNDVHLYGSPIRRMPPEVILQFFQWYTFEESIPIPWEFTQSPTAILHVCSAWRSLALGDPDFWRNILIALNVESQHFATQLQETLLRSNSRSLWLHLHGDRIPCWMNSFTNLMLPIWERAVGFDLIWRGENNPVPSELRVFYEDLNPAFPFHPYLHQFTELILDGVTFPMQALFHLLQKTSSLRKLVYKPTNEGEAGEIDVAQLPHLHPIKTVTLPKLTDLTLRTYQWRTEFYSILRYIHAPLRHLAFIALDEFRNGKQSWTNRFGSPIIHFSSTLITLRLDLKASALEIGRIVSCCTRLEEFIVPCVDAPAGSYPFSGPLMILPHLTRLVAGCTNLEEWLGKLERRGSTTAQCKYRLKDVLLIWDMEDDKGAGSFDDMLARIDLLNDGGMRVKLAQWEELDFEVDLAQQI